MRRVFLEPLLKAAREFVKGLDRKQRFDMNKNGLEITAKSAGATTEAPAQKSAETALVERSAGPDRIFRNLSQTVTSGFLCPRSRGHQNFDGNAAAAMAEIVDADYSARDSRLMEPSTSEWRHLINRRMPKV